ncbi:hypothetical protein [Pseudoduganella albidiflava]|uniref:HK97 gp10 family phage protein n=1 Tax=Pseudoduganella albidiflava TaxID=321983 RepID=A0A411X366_9BURK|nr:hypothetical protein [Pseudoduganella albidiflava]QBI03312.1 hypothetical protein EYF70_22645 [Pseudoduganella albidiflava]GGY67815.1 hypothetical protein GCM10007387_57490 [Pseudoduganella albidiflava]
MSVLTEPSADTKPAHDFRATAVDLAAQLQTASRTAAGLAVVIARSEQAVEVLKKHMTPAQRIHAQLEIDALQAQDATTLGQYAAAAVGGSAAAWDVLAERRRQVEIEGWTPGHDDRYGSGEMAIAGGCYALYSDTHLPGQPPVGWPWDRRWWKPQKWRSDLVRAAALIIAEIERIDRARQRREK